MANPNYTVNGELFFQRLEDTLSYNYPMAPLALIAEQTPILTMVNTQNLQKHMGVFDRLWEDIKAILTPFPAYQDRISAIQAMASKLEGKPEDARLYAETKQSAIVDYFFALNAYGRDAKYYKNNPELHESAVVLSQELFGKTLRPEEFVRAMGVHCYDVTLGGIYVQEPHQMKELFRAFPYLEKNESSLRLLQETTDMMLHTVKSQERHVKAPEIPANLPADLAERTYLLQERTAHTIDPKQEKHEEASVLLLLTYLADPQKHKQGLAIDVQEQMFKEGMASIQSVNEKQSASKSYPVFADGSFSLVQEAEHQEKSVVLASIVEGSPMRMTGMSYSVYLENGEKDIIHAVTEDQNGNIQSFKIPDEARSIYYVLDKINEQSVTESPGISSPVREEDRVQDIPDDSPERNPEVAFPEEDEPEIEFIEEEEIGR